MQGGSSDDHYPTYKSVNKYRERSGLIPITAKIFNKLEIKYDDTLEYEEVPISDIVIVGYITDYKEEEILINLKVWDGTGTINAQFFNKNESEVHPGLSGFNYTGNRRLVRLFGLAKVFKKEKQFSGNKIFYTDDRDFQLHTFEVIYSWLYLTGKKEVSQNMEGIKYERERLNVNENIYSRSNNNFNNYSNQMTSQDNIVFEQIKELSRNNKKVPIPDVIMKLSHKISKEKVIDIIQNLCNNGYLIEEGTIVKLL